MELAAAQNQSFIALLRGLQPDDWNRPTDCDRWSVKDIAAHISAWAEALLSPREYFHQVKAARKVRSELPTAVDAQNEAQVLERRALPPEELIARLEKNLPRFLKLRKNLGGVLGPLPTYSGLLGFVPLRTLTDEIFTRDMLVHRFDISRGVGHELVLGPHDVRVIKDCIKEWAKRSGADVRLELTGPAGGTYLAGSGKTATISGDANTFFRLLAKRASVSELKIEGDAAAAERWLAVGCRV
jgi:uncharacterized protein (TIGR03083 family)